jgi:hypothetical protein
MKNSVYETKVNISEEICHRIIDAERRTNGCCSTEVPDYLEFQMPVAQLSLRNGRGHVTFLSGTPEVLSQSHRKFRVTI